MQPTRPKDLNPKTETSTLKPKPQTKPETQNPETPKPVEQIFEGLRYNNRRVGAELDVAANILFGG